MKSEIAGVGYFLNFVVNFSFRERRPRPPRPFPCSFCARRFDSLDAVDFHIATQHANRDVKNIKRAIGEWKQGEMEKDS
jgi:hypothetical protein